MKIIHKLTPDEVRDIIRRHYDKNNVVKIEFDVGQKTDYYDQVTGYTLKEIVVELEVTP